MNSRVAVFVMFALLLLPSLSYGQSPGSTRKKETIIVYGVFCAFSESQKPILQATYRNQGDAEAAATSFREDSANGKRLYFKVEVRELEEEVPSTSSGYDPNPDKIGGILTLPKSKITGSELKIVDPGAGPKLRPSDLVGKTLKGQVGSTDLVFSFTSNTSATLSKDEQVANAEWTIAFDGTLTIRAGNSTLTGRRAGDLIVGQRVSKAGNTSNMTIWLGTPKAEQKGQAYNSPQLAGSVKPSLSAREIADKLRGKWRMSSQTGPYIVGEVYVSATENKVSVDKFGGTGATFDGTESPLNEDGSFKFQMKPGFANQSSPIEGEARLVGDELHVTMRQDGKVCTGTWSKVPR